MYILAGILAGALLFTGCSNQQNAKQESSSGAAASGTQKIRQVSVGIGTGFEPYAYIDANNQPAGYDVAVLKEIAARLPQYEFKYQSIELKNLLLSLDAKK